MKCINDTVGIPYKGKVTKLRRDIIFVHIQIFNILLLPTLSTLEEQHMTIHLEMGLTN